MPVGNEATTALKMQQLSENEASAGETDPAQAAPELCSSQKSSPPSSFLINTGSRIHFMSVEQIVKFLYCTRAGFAIADCHYVTQSSSGQGELPKLSSPVLGQGETHKARALPQLSPFLLV